MTVHWGDVRKALEADIVQGVLKPGDQLPTEPELCRKFDAGRHSVRRAIAAMAVDGMLRAEQGRGTFVEETALIDYTIGKRTRRTENFASNHVTTGGHVLSFEICPAGAEIAARLALEPDAPVLSVTRLSEADGLPIAYGTIYRSDARFPDFLDRQAALGSVTKTYASYGIDDYVRASTNILARRATEVEAQHLHQHLDQPVLLVKAVDADAKGRPISYSEVVWAATRVSFSLDTGGTFDA